MSDLRRIVFDTSTLVGAALRVGSTPHRVLAAAFATAEVCVSESTLVELELVLGRAKFDRYQALSARMAFVALVRQHAVCYAVRAEHQAQITPPCRDPKDNPFLALCVACEAHALVSSDDDLLVLHPWNGVLVVSPGDMNSLLNS